MKTRWIPLIFLGSSGPLAAAEVPFVAADTAIDDDLVDLRDLAVGEMDRRGQALGTRTGDRHRGHVPRRAGCDRIRWCP